jgi:hypothetical protein
MTTEHEGLLRLWVSANEPTVVCHHACQEWQGVALANTNPLYARAGCSKARLRQTSSQEVEVRRSKPCAPERETRSLALRINGQRRNAGNPRRLGEVVGDGVVQVR